MKKRLLVVDDIQETIEGVLEEIVDRGVQVDCVTNLTDAMSQLRENTYDGMILDWRVRVSSDGPVDDDAGGKLLKQFASGEVGEANRNIPILVVTAQWSAVDHRQVKETVNCQAVVDKMQLGHFDEELAEMLG